METALFSLPFLGAILPSHLMAIGYLVLLEFMLSFDNAIALAALVKGRLKDPKDQAHALHWGIWGAYIFRTIVIFAGVWLMEHTWVKVLAGLYLVYLAVSELFFAGKPDEDGENEVGGMSFQWLKLTPVWSAVVAVELMDIMFSVDSIGVALAVSDVKWVLISGAILGIVMMRYAAGFFIKLIDHFPILSKTAFVLVGLAGANVVLKAANIHIPETIFLGSMLLILVGSVILSKLGLFKQASAH